MTKAEQLPERSKNMFKYLAILAFVLAIAVVGCAQQAAAPAPSIASGERVYYVTGLEYKGSTVTKDLAAPDADPAKLSDGYRYKKPGDADKADATKWEVSTYRWEPGEMLAFVGDKVTLVSFIVNGDKHTTWVEGPDGKEVIKQVTMNRGREYKVSFTADKPGLYKLKCDEHDPTMTAFIWALPRQ
jgi:plastocyanin